MPDRNRECRLADAARSYDRHETFCAQPGGYLLDFDLAVDHRKTYRQIRMLKCRGIFRSRTLSERARDLSHERVASSRRIHDVTVAFSPVAERLAQARHVKPQAALLNDKAGPDLTQQIALADQLVGSREKGQQKVVSTSA